MPQYPIRGQNSEYGLIPMPFTQPPDPQAQTVAFRAWQAVGVSIIEQTVQGSPITSGR